MGKNGRDGGRTGRENGEKGGAVKNGSGVLKGGLGNVTPARIFPCHRDTLSVGA
jgi:hypothetical protein